MDTNLPQRARLATLDELLRDVVPNHISPPPLRDTFRAWLDRANIPRFKTNMAARRGGGVCFYSVSHVEKLLTRTVAPR